MFSEFFSTFAIFTRAMSNISPKPNPSFLEAKHKLEAYCAYQERCMQEIIEKLAGWGFYGEQQDNLIEVFICLSIPNKNTNRRAISAKSQHVVVDTLS